MNNVINTWVRDLHQIEKDAVAAGAEHVPFSDQEFWTQQVIDFADAEDQPVTADIAVAIAKQLSAVQFNAAPSEG